MKLLIAAICLTAGMAVAQAQTVLPPDNGTELNPDGTSNFKTPIGLDLMAGNQKGITIFPSRENDVMLISVKGDCRERRSIVLSTLTGKQVFRTDGRTENTFLVDTSGLGKGVYVIEVRSGKNVYRKKWARS